MLKQKKNIIIISLTIFILAIVMVLICSFIKPSKKDNALADIEETLIEVRKAYNNFPNYWGLDNIITPANENIFIGEGFEINTIMPGARTFDIIYKNLNKKECVLMLSTDLPKDIEITLISLSIQGIEEATFSWGEENSLPISKKIANKICKNDNNNNILWTFE